MTESAVKAKKGIDDALKVTLKFFSTCYGITSATTDIIDYNQDSNPTSGTSDTVSDTQPITSEEQNPAVNPESTANVHPLTNEQNPENIIVKLLNQMFATQDPKERQELFEIAFKEAEAEPGLLESLAKAVENILGHNNTLSYPY
jgi:hypothetical protein